MVSVKTASQSGKRKKAEDMLDSPPKRVTRARAKATEETGSISNVKRIATPSIKVSTQKKRLVEPIKPTKRKTRADGNVADPVTEAISDDESKEVTKSRGRQKKTTDDTKGQMPTSEVPAPTRGRRSKATVTEPNKVEVPKLRGRPKKAIGETAQSAVQAQKVSALESREEAMAEQANIPVNVKQDPIVRTSVVRKKVKFQDESAEGAEKFPIKTRGLAKSDKATGLKAKPVRKPATVRSAAHGRKAQEKGIIKNGVKALDSRPLSPKKIKQVAKSSSIDSEDELGYGKLPLRALSESPLKSTSQELENYVPRLEFGKMREPSSPAKIITPGVLASPARRPPPSPFKDALKISPKRANLGGGMVIPVMKDSCLTAKSSLLQSPARRPPVSPVKLITSSSPQKFKTTTPLDEAAVASKHAKPIKLPLFSPSKTSNSPLRAAGSPQRLFEVHKIDEAEQAAAIDSEPVKSPKSAISKRNFAEHEFTASTPPKFFEKSVQNAEEEGSSQALVSPKTIHCATVFPDDLASQKLIDQVSIEHEGAQGTTPPDPTAPFIGSAFWFATPTLRVPHEDSDSEDELTSFRKPCNQVSTVKQGNLSKELSTSASNGEIEWTPIPSGNVKAYAMTPLATQLSSWLVSSPEKQTTLKEEKRGIFSPLGTTSNKPTSDLDHSVVETPPKSSFFEDEMIVRDKGDQASDSHQVDYQEIHDAVEASQDSMASEEYGDENAVPMDPQLTATKPGSDEAVVTCTPAKVFQQPREIHTVSKVPLRPAHDDSPLKMPRKRSRSLAGPLRSVSSMEVSHLGNSSNVPPDLYGEFGTIQPAEVANQIHIDQTRFDSNSPQALRENSCSNPGTPSRTVRQGVAPNILEGAVVFVDVHTTEGADASGIFLDLLSQMGARCVKQWAWNPRSGTSSGDDSTGISPDPAPAGNKVGITHVIFKDGGKRTLEKVREAKGVVLCVGVGWVLE